MPSKPLSKSLFQEMQSRPEDFRVQERVPLIREGVTWPFLLDAPTSRERSFLIINPSTNKRDSSEATIIELAAVRGFYCVSSGTVTRIENVFHSLNDPGSPLDWPFSEMLGFSDALLKEQKIDTDLINEWLKEDPLIITIDDADDVREPFERLFNSYSSLEWTSYENDVRCYDRWRKDFSIEGRLRELGWFWEEDTFIPSVTNCLALVWLFHEIPLLFQELLQKVLRGTVKISAPNKVEGISRRGYCDFYQGKYLPYAVKECDVLYKDRELDWLYKQGLAPFQVGCVHISARERFKRDKGSSD